MAETKFTFDGNTGRAEDFNNYHFGVVGKAFGEFSEGFMLRTAGGVEMAKYKAEYEQGKRPSPLVPLSWRPTLKVTTTTSFFTGPGMGGAPITETHDVLLPPYGDNPVDHDLIKRGFNYYNAHSQELDGD